eukprot:TRINITY_DN6352_c1_g1_i1.p1 TRINITY_DN6352_c1_g1~~TRINITY_DN6352_c1_g1_i1.p1  ORF type:complete len:275 (-),score=48.47 TRINITY_DN6352_c1_g1_i1:128-898(-)
MPSGLSVNFQVFNVDAEKLFGELRESIVDTVRKQFHQVYGLEQSALRFSVSADKSTNQDADRIKVVGRIALPQVAGSENEKEASRGAKILKDRIMGDGWHIARESIQNDINNLKNIGVAKTTEEFNIVVGDIAIAILAKSASSSTGPSESDTPVAVPADSCAHIAVPAESGIPSDQSEVVHPATKVHAPTCLPSPPVEEQTLSTDQGVANMAGCPGWRPTEEECGEFTLDRDDDPWDQPAIFTLGEEETTSTAPPA